MIHRLQVQQMGIVRQALEPTWFIEGMAYSFEKVRDQGNLGGSRKWHIEAMDFENDLPADHSDKNGCYVSNYFCLHRLT